MDEFDELEKEVTEFENIDLRNMDEKAIKHLANLAVSIYVFHKKLEPEIEPKELLELKDLEEKKQAPKDRIYRAADFVRRCKLTPYSWKKELAKYALEGAAVVGVSTAMIATIHHYSSPPYIATPEEISASYSVAAIPAIFSPLFYFLYAVRGVKESKELQSDEENKIMENKEKLDIYMKKVFGVFRNDLYFAKKIVEDGKEAHDYLIECNKGLVDAYGEGDLNKSIEALNKEIDNVNKRMDRKGEAQELGPRLRELYGKISELETIKRFEGTYESFKGYLSHNVKTLRDYREKVSLNKLKPMLVSLPFIVVASLFLMTQHNVLTGDIVFSAWNISLILSLITLSIITILFLKLGK